MGLEGNAGVEGRRGGERRGKAPALFM